MRMFFKLAFLGLIVTSSVACGSSLEQRYLQAGYSAAGPAGLKRIAIVPWAPHSMAPLAGLMAAIAKDRLNLKTDYLVYKTHNQMRSWSEGCGELEATLFLQALPIPPEDATGDDDERDLHIRASLFSCKTGALIWWAEAMDTIDIENEDLAQLTSNYITQLGEEVRPYTVPAFILLRDLLDDLPNPKLTDDEIMEKIELD